METYDAKKDFRSIDFKKLKQDIKDGGGHDWRYWYAKRKEHGAGYVNFPTPKGVSAEWTWEASNSTLLCAVAAFLHGKLSMTKKRIPLCDASGGTEVVPFTEEEQKKLVGTLWKMYLRPEKTEVLPVEAVAQQSA